ncbi:unnamed protein product [Plutella xylostella]|uniref:(diamondback moth) hypothetical protein n=1 Tax=Plutella xylostella TaxID=51655 RepID=A0A8S4EBE4_PLUXY|nr:unnamed protein product [Plutella xylostella]
MLTQYLCTVATLILICQNVFGSFVIPRIPFNPNQVCYLSKACHHSGRAVCGLNILDGKKRRFLDSCDMLEFNCVYNKDYQIRDMKECIGLENDPDELNEISVPGSIDRIRGCRHRPKRET